MGTSARAMMAPSTVGGGTGRRGKHLRPVGRGYSGRGPKTGHQVSRASKSSPLCSAAVRHGVDQGQLVQGRGVPDGEDEVEEQEGRDGSQQHGRPRRRGPTRSRGRSIQPGVPSSSRGHHQGDQEVLHHVRGEEVLLAQGVQGTGRPGRRSAPRRRTPPPARDPAPPVAPGSGPPGVPGGAGPPGRSRRPRRRPAPGRRGRPGPSAPARCPGRRASAPPRPPPRAVPPSL